MIINVITPPICGLNVFSRLERNCVSWICRNLSLADSKAHSLGFFKVFSNLDLLPQIPLDSHQSSTCSPPCAPALADSRFIRSINTVTTSNACNMAVTVCRSLQLSGDQDGKRTNSSVAASELGVDFRSDIHIFTRTNSAKQLCLHGVTRLQLGIPWSVPSN